MSGRSCRILIKIDNKKGGPKLTDQPNNIFSAKIQNIKVKFFSKFRFGLSKSEHFWKIRTSGIPALLRHKKYKKVSQKNLAYHF